ncbi:collagen-like protein [Geomicrobium sp. JSM 1781026]|uniref:collagen-like protein n=1 Tax=Geomicrobium sp. JSM 1781026 TaxID=3344580 RepID=UPI0035C12FE4
MYNQQRIISIPFPLPGLPGGGGPPGGGWQPGPPPGGGGPPGGWQPGPPPGGGGQPPSGPPPSFVPTQAQATPFAIDSGAISFCQLRFTYLWLRNGQNFWYYPIFIGRRSVAGFRWTGRSWVFFGVDTNQITSFTCQ